MPKAYTIDIETLPLPAYLERAPAKLKRQFDAGTLRAEKRSRYQADPNAEAEREYRLGGLNATSGRVLSIAVHIGTVPTPEISEGVNEGDSEHVFGISQQGEELSEIEALSGFLALLKNFESRHDEIVGFNILRFDLPFIFQRCVANSLPVRAFVNLSETPVRGVYDIMPRWQLTSGSDYPSLDDIAWTLGLRSSKRKELEGALVLQAYESGRLAEIREYNLDDVRVTRKVYERMVAVLGR